jgi:hypothetical protein
VRWALVLLLTLVACNDLREFRGDWRGPRVGDAAVLRVGMASSGAAELLIDRVDEHGLGAMLTIDGLVPAIAISSIPGADADVLGGLSFGGSPLRVYLAFVELPDGGGEAVAVVALYDDRRVEVRVMRGGSSPLYGIFALTESSG